MYPVNLPGGHLGLSIKGTVEEAPSVQLSPAFHSLTFGIIVNSLG